MLQNIALLFLTNRYKLLHPQPYTPPLISNLRNLGRVLPWLVVCKFKPDNVFLLDPCWIFELSLCHTLGGAQKGIVWQ
ncbi:hypothetical protein POPTR_017G139650v4 [Populus trichocarpa]|uniref:Protein TIC 40, chloroplastic n=1 Tax=Populus trichocarpa TaxID=3694 RepID=A0A2K1X7B2_POPTR|nr:hypothetical protein BDE02_17G119800 [Populus trichocarpa]PNS96666.2 hypothetical protein POPTR_017G139650v4 [Populus trichocarpa]